MIPIDMTIFQNRKKLFRQPTTAEKLVMFQSLLDSHDIQPEDALAWLGSIHAELRQPHKGQDGSVYACYARTIESLRHQSPDIHQYVITNWQAHQPESRTSDFDQFIAKLGGVDSGIKNVHEANGQAMQDAESSEGSEGDGGEIMATEAAEHMAELTYVPIEEELGPDEDPFMEAGE